jgi:hypothetical protein
MIVGPHSLGFLGHVVRTAAFRDFFRSSCLHRRSMRREPCQRLWWATRPVLLIFQGDRCFTWICYSFLHAVPKYAVPSAGDPKPDNVFHVLRLTSNEIRGRVIQPCKFLCPMMHKHVEPCLNDSFHHSDTNFARPVHFHAASREAHPPQLKPSQGARSSPCQMCGHAPPSIAT